MIFNFKNNKSLEITWNRGTYLQKPRVLFIPEMLFHTKDWCYDIRRYVIRYLFFGWLSYIIQEKLYKKKIYWHNIVTNECTRGFECCIDKVNEEDKDMLKQIAYAAAEGIPIIHINKKEV